MVTHHSKDGHPPSKIYQKEEYYRLEIWHQDLTQKIRTRWSTMDSQPQSPGWSRTIPRMVTHHPKDGHPPSQGESQSISRLSVSVLTNSMVSDLVLRLRLRWFLSQTQSQKLRPKEYQPRSRYQKSKRGLTDHWHNFGQLQCYQCLSLARLSALVFSHWAGLTNMMTLMLYIQLWRGWCGPKTFNSTINFGI